MKAKLFFSILLLAIVAAGCSKSKQRDTLPMEEWVENESLPVPIQFGAGGLDVDTKAALEGTTLSNVTLGLYGLAMSGDSEYGRKNDQQAWSDDPQTILLDNFRTTTDDSGNMDLTDKYYPIDNELTFSFFGYYPYDANATIVEDAGNGGHYIKAEYELGDKDIIYGASHATTVRQDNPLNGFNAAYFRYLKRTSGGQWYEPNLPMITFNHLLTALSFNAMVSEDGTGATGTDSNIILKSIELRGTCTKAILYIADTRTSNNKSGTLAGDESTLVEFPEEGAEDTQKGIVLDINNGTGIRLLTNQNQDNPIGELLVLPQNNYTIRVSYDLVNSSGETISSHTTTAADLYRSSLGFQAGKRYTVSISITAPVGLDVRTELTDWVDTGFNHPITF